MKLYVESEKGRAICHRDGLVTTTFQYRDVPFSDGSGIVTDVLVALCDVCGDLVAIPPQSTPAIKAEREKANVSVETQLPAFYLETLDLAAYRIAPHLSTDFRKNLIAYYVHGFAQDQKRQATLPTTLKMFQTAFPAAEQQKRRKRLSMKVTPSLYQDISQLMAATAMSRTDLIKSLVGHIHREVILPEKPRELAALRTFAAAG